MSNESNGQNSPASPTTGTPRQENIHQRLQRLSREESTTGSKFVEGEIGPITLHAVGSSEVDDSGAQVHGVGDPSPVGSSETKLKDRGLSKAELRALILTFLDLLSQTRPPERS